MSVVRRLSALAALGLSACATAPGASDSAAESSLGTPAPLAAAETGQVPQVIACLKRGAASLKIPDDYLQTRALPGGGQSLALINPATRRQGLTVEVRPGPHRARVVLHERGAVVSAKWRNLVQRCVAV